MADMNSAVLFYGIVCKAAQFYETAEAVGCKHDQTPIHKFCSECGARTKGKYKRPIPGYDGDKELIVGEHHFEIFKPGLCSDIFVGHTVDKTSGACPVNLNNGSNKLLVDARSALCMIGLAETMQDFRLWLVRAEER